MRKTCVNYSRRIPVRAGAFASLLIIVPLLTASPRNFEEEELGRDSSVSGTIARLEALGARVSVQASNAANQMVHVELLGLPFEPQWHGGDEGIHLIQELPHVSLLRVQNNEGFTDQGMSYLRDLDGLRSLTLIHTSVTDMGLANLHGLQNLEHLSLNSNHFTDAGLRHLHQQTNLKSLRLDGTQITNDGLKILKENGTLETIEFLSLNRTQIADDGLRYLRGMTYLKSLYLSFTRITDIGMAHLHTLPDLEKIILNSTSITDAGMVHLQHMDKLWLLYLSHTHITDQGVRRLESLGNLSHLWLGSTQITEASLPRLQAFSNLEELDVSDTRITDAAWIHLRELKNLKTLYLNKTDITEEGHSSLKEALPDCDIGWRKPKTLRVGDPAPEITLERLLQATGDTKLSWTTLRGKVVVLEFWATWCGPCVVSIPHLNELAEAFESKPVQFIAITSEEQSVVEAFLRKQSLQGWIGLDTGSSMARNYEASTIPHTIIVDQNGIIRVITHPQQLTEQTLNAVLNSSEGI